MSHIKLFLIEGDKLQFLKKIMAYARLSEPGNLGVLKKLAKKKR